MNAEDAKSAEHNREVNVPADRSGETEIESGKDGRASAPETENFFVVHTMED